MITYYFDLNARQVVQSPGNPQPLQSQTWVYFDNYNLQVYICAQGIILPINAGDSIGALLFVPGGTLPEQGLAVIGTPSHAVDANGNAYFLLNANLATAQLATLVQTPNKPAQCAFHFIFYPTDSERFSSSQDITTTVNPDPTRDATGASPVPPGYPVSPNVFEVVANKGAPNGYAPLDATSKVPVANLPPTSGGGDMLKSVYDTGGSANPTGIVKAAQNATAAQNANQVPWTGVQNPPATFPPAPHQASHNGGSDPIPLTSTTTQGLCPPIDGSSVQIVGGKLTAPTAGGGDMHASDYDTTATNPTKIVRHATNADSSTTLVGAGTIVPYNAPASPTLAASGEVVLGQDSRLTNSRTPTAHAASHVSPGTDQIALATLSLAGLCPSPDGVTITISASKLAAILATATAPGIVKPDGTTITVGTGANAGIISAAGSLPAVNAHVNQSTAQALSATASTWTAIQFGAADFQNGGTLWVIGNPTRLTIPAGQGGIYAIGAVLTFAISATGTQRQIQLRLSTGTVLATANTVTGGTSGVWAPAATISTIVSIAAAAYVEVYAAADVASLNTGPSLGPVNFWIYRIG